MRLTRLQTRGLKGLSQFPSGVDFNFDALPDGLVAIVGPNGAGKSTFLEASFAGLFGTFPSRPDCALMDSVDGRDAFIDVQVAIDGRGTYRARVNVDGVKRVTDAVLELHRPDGSSERLNDGKISTFKTAVGRALPSLPLLLASAFAAQNKAGSFAKLEKKERRELFAKLLGLERYEQMATASRAAALLVDKALTVQRTLRDRLRLTTTDTLEADLSATGNALQADLTEVQLDRTRLTREMETAAAAIEQLRGQAARHIAATAEGQAAERRREDLRQGRARLEADRGALALDETRDLDAIERRQLVAVAGLQRDQQALKTFDQLDVELTRVIRDIDTRLAAAVLDRDQRIGNNRHLLDRSEVIRAAVQVVATQAALVAEQEQRIADAEAVSVTLRQIDLRARALLINEKTVQAERDRLARSAGLIAQVPCGAAEAYAGCQFLKDAVAARAALEGLADADARVLEAQASFDAAAAAVATNETEIADARRARDRARVAGAAAKADADLVAKLDAAQTRVTELEAEQATLRADAEAARAAARVQRIEAEGDVTQERERIDAAILAEQTTAEIQTGETKTRYATRREDIDTRVVQLDADLVAVETEIASLTTVITANAGAHASLTAADSTHRTLRQRWDDSSHRLAGLREQIAAFERRREDFQTARAECARLESVVRQLETELIEWEAFARVFGREGLPTLEIDAAGPGVSALANDLLDACFGSRFQVELVTQDVKADGKGMKEIFELKVWDAERGGEALDLQLLSGGEQVIVDEAVRAAVSLFINQRNEMPIRTIFRDETTGALDPENALRYVAMLRRLLERSGASQLLFITHAPDAAALADAQIVIAGGKLDVRYPPFAAIESEAA